MSRNKSLTKIKKSLWRVCRAEAVVSGACTHTLPLRLLPQLNCEASEHFYCVVNYKRGGRGGHCWRTRLWGHPASPVAWGGDCGTPVKTLSGLPSVAEFWGLQPSCRKNRRSCSPVTVPRHCALLSLLGWCWGPTRGSSAPRNPFRWLCFGLKERKRIRMLGKQSDVSTCK